MKKLKAIAVILILAFLAGSFIPVPIKINQNYSGIRYNSEQEEKVNIKISGWYRLYLLPFFKDNYFTGDINVGDINCHYHRWAKLSFPRSLNWAVMHYYAPEPNAMDSLGILRQKDLFKEISISMKEGKDGERTVTSAPAENREEAEAIYKRIFYEFQ